VETTPEAEDDFEALLVYLRDARGVDFTGYKRPSLTRLVHRRMRTAGVDEYAAYVDLLQVEPGELAALLDTLLINVTAVFRDPAAWDELRAQLPLALGRLAPDEPVRAWSAACATGEEAYSLAILLHELLGDEDYKARVKVYATDIDDAALAHARAGRFTPSALEALTEEQRTTYFEPEGDVLRFRADLRPTLIFGRHDLQQDAPISRVVLLACRNVLMYFTPEAQTRVLDRLAFALHEHGLLLLGKAEMLLTQSQLFVPVNLQQRIFRSRRVAPAARLAALAVGGQGRDATVRRATEVAFDNAPASQLVLDAHGALALINERAERDLRLSRSDLGKPFHELEISYRPRELRGSVAAVQASREVVEMQDVEWPQPGGTSTRWDVRISPLVDEDEVFGVHLVFDDVTERHELRARLDQVHQELSTAYEELQSSSEELETTNEELQSAVEELETTNEELQSTNEELETMNEELQSTNEELQTLNDELRERTLQVDDVNAFLQSIVEGLDAAVVVVDGDYRVQLWNSGAERLSGLRAFEAEGLRFLDLDLDLPVDEVHGLLRAVVVQGRERATLDVQVTNRFGRRHTRTLVVSRLFRGQQQVGGAVLTLLDSPAAEDGPAEDARP
jgi:two-component system, chemotaxis family, CheB/CheR fusion protein